MCRCQLLAISHQQKLSSLDCAFVRCAPTKISLGMTMILEVMFGTSGTRALPGLFSVLWTRDYFAALANFTPFEFAAYRAMPLYSASAICSR